MGGMGGRLMGGSSSLRRMETAGDGRLDVLLCFVDWFGCYETNFGNRDGWSFVCSGDYLMGVFSFFFGGVWMRI